MLESALKLFTRRAPRIVRSVRKAGLTYLREENLADLHERVRALESARLPGVLIEAGCAAGGSALVLASAKSIDRPLYIHDVFGTIPPPSPHDGQDCHERYELIRSGQSPGIRGQRYYGYETELLAKVQANFHRFGLPPDWHNVHFVQGRYEDTLRVTQPVALAHIDCDWYSSVRTCLEQIEPRLVTGGVLVIDDYKLAPDDHGYSGCVRAVDEYFADKAEDYDFQRRSRLHIVRR